MSEQPCFDTVMKRNYIERLKHEKNPDCIMDELPQFVESGYEAIPEEDIVRMHWWGLFHDKPKIGNFCMRIKIPGGILSPKQLRGIGEISIEHGKNYAELTTRQNVQIHWLQLPIVQGIFKRLGELDLTTKGGCGDTVRNITGCPISGLHKDELFDTSSMLFKTSRLLDEIAEYSDLPRKHKITISSCPDWCTAPEIHCQALIAVEQNGRQGFALRIGGGLSSTPRISKSLRVFVEPQDVEEVLRATLDEWRSQNRYRVSRVRSRMKFMMDDYGPEAFRELIEKRLGRKLEDLAEEPQPASSTLHMGIHPQKQPGLYYIGFPVFSGKVTGEQMLIIADLLESFGGDFRITRQQNFILTGVPEAQINRVVDEIGKLGYAPAERSMRANSIGCTGDPYCNYAVVDSKGALRSMINHLEQVFDAETIREINLSINIDACPHACAKHWVSDIGLQGTTLRRRGEMNKKVEAFEIYLRGGLGKNAAIARPIIHRVPHDEVNLYVERLIRAYLNEKQAGESIQKFFARKNNKELIAIAAGQIMSIPQPQLVPA